MTMKVWVVEHDSYGDVQVWSYNTDPTEIPIVSTELSYLEGGHEDERDEFLDDLDRAIRLGRGSASIEERFTITLESVREV